MKLHLFLLITISTNSAWAHIHGQNNNHKHKNPEFMHKYPSIEEIGVFEETPNRITEDPEKRKLTSEPHPIKIFVDDSSLKRMNPDMRDYLVHAVAKQGNKILAEKIKVKTIQFLRGNTFYYRACPLNSMISAPEITQLYQQLYYHPDFILFLGYEGRGKSYYDYGGPCIIEKGNVRPSVGFAVFNLTELEELGANFDRDVSNYVHKVIQALGFNALNFKHFPPTKEGKPQYFVSNGRHYLRGDNLMAVARDHFQCYDKDFIGVPLEYNIKEDDYYDFSFERTIFGNEIMAPRQLPMAKFSKMTLAVLKDSGWYDIDLSKGDLWMWGRGEGCAAVNKTCKKSSVDEKYRSNNYVGCDKTFKFKMSSTPSDSTDQCKIKRSGYSCIIPDFRKYEHNFEESGLNSRCQEFKHKGEKKAACVKIECNRSKTAYEVKLDGKTKAKFTCKSEGQVETPWEGYEFFCENPKLICRSFCPRSCYNQGKCLENGKCFCDLFYSGEICGTMFVRDTYEELIYGMPRDTFHKTFSKNGMITSKFINTFGPDDFDVDYLKYFSLNDKRSGHLMETDSVV